MEVVLKEKVLSSLPYVIHIYKLYSLIYNYKLYVQNSLLFMMLLLWHVFLAIILIQKSHSISDFDKVG